jgi:spore germination cell wall hydrolase CwlJ-like protein
MIHFETYVPGTKQNSRWLAGGAKPASLLNPTVLLLNLAATGERIHTNGAHSNTDGKSGKSGQIADGAAAGGGGGGGGGTTPVSIVDEDLITLARTIYGEARSRKEPPAGREGVAHVVINRVKRKHFGDTTVKGVCLHRLQFSCWNMNDPNRSKIISILPGADPIFDECCAIAERVMKGLLADNTGGATHYYAKSIAAPDWARSPPAQQTVQIGSHLFFRNVP